MKDILGVAIDAASEAGAFLLARQGSVRSVEAKADRSLVTDVDREAEQIIVERIESVFPGHDIVGEERAATDRGSEYRWIIDPLDGTHNYLRGIGSFGVSIGIRRGKEFFAGIVFLPQTDALYAAERGSGAFRNSERIRVSRRSDLSACSVAFDSDMRRDSDAKLPALGRLAATVFNVRVLGSSARVLTHVAEGALDAAVEFDDRIWDFAAGIVIVEEAGGRVTTFSGDAMPDASSGYVASNGLVHERVRATALPPLRRPTLH